MSNTNTALAVLDEATRDVAVQIKSVLGFEGSDADLALFATVARRMNLDPFSKQVYAVFRNQKTANGWSKRMMIQTGIDGYRAIAFRTGALDAIGEPEFGPLEKGKPSFAKVAVYRKGAAHPTVGVAYWEEYVQTDREGNPMGLWSKMPRTMLAKCAESQALRKAFPEALSGLYTDEEMSQAVEPTTPRVIQAAEVAEAPAEEVVEIVAPKAPAREPLADDGKVVTKEHVQMIVDLVRDIRAMGNQDASIAGIERKAGKRVKEMTQGELFELHDKLQAVYVGLVAARTKEAVDAKAEKPEATAVAA